MAILGRGLLDGLPLGSNSLLIGIDGILDELPAGNPSQVLTIGDDHNIFWDSLDNIQVTGMTEVQDDHNPVLGGQLNANSFKIFNLGVPVNATDAATKAYVDSLKGGAPSTLDTLGEIASAINNDPAFFITIGATIDGKVSRTGDTMTGALHLTSSGAPRTPLQNDEATTKKYVDDSITASISLLDNIGNVSALSPTNGQVLTYNTSTNAWIAQNPTTGVNAFVQLTDTPNSITANQFVKGNSTGTALIFGSALVSGDNIGLLNNNVGYINSISADLSPQLAADLNAATHRIINLSAPTLGTDATNKTYVDNAISTTVGNKVDRGGDTMTGFLTLSGTPTNALHAATKQYVDNVVSGLDVKISVKAATASAANLSGYTYTAGSDDNTSATPLVWTNVFSSPVFDGVTITDGQRVLIKNASNSKGNGIFTYDATAHGFRRAADADNSTGNEVSGGLFTFIEAGTTLSGTGWVLSNPAGLITLGVTDMTFSQFSGTNQIVGGNGINVTGNVISAVGSTNSITVDTNGISIAATYPGQASIVTVGTITTGTWRGTAIDNQRGGFGRDISSYAAKSLITRDGTELPPGSANMVLVSNGTAFSSAYVNAIRDPSQTGSATLSLAPNAAASDNILVADYTTLASGDPAGALATKGYVDSKIVASSNTWGTISSDTGTISPSSTSAALAINADLGLKTLAAGSAITISMDFTELASVTPTSGQKIMIFDGSTIKTIDVGSLSTGSGASNFTDLDDAPSVIEANKFVRGDSMGTALEFATVIVPGDNISLLTNNSGFITDVVDDTTPQLGGNLDVVDKTITTSTTNGNITLNPNGNGMVEINGIFYSSRIHITINNNATANILVYPASNFDVVFVDYGLAREPHGSKTGTLQIINNGVNVSVADIGAELGSPGVNFNGNINGTNVEISYTSDDAGAAGDMSFQVRRWNIQ